MPPAIAAQNNGVGPRRGKACGDMIDTMARIAPSRPNEAMARIALAEMAPFHSTKAAGSKFPSKVLWTRFEMFSKVKTDSKSGLGSAVPGKGLHATSQAPVTRTQNFTCSVAAISDEPPCSVATFVENSEPHTGARPLVRFCVGLIKFGWHRYVF
jgi:hypothetical protein